MNDKMFEALLEAVRDIGQELMFIRDEVTEIRNLYGQVHGFESDGERDERIQNFLKENKFFDSAAEE